MLLSIGEYLSGHSFPFSSLPKAPHSCTYGCYSAILHTRGQARDNRRHTVADSCIGKWEHLRIRKHISLCDIEHARWECWQLGFTDDSDSVEASSSNFGADGVVARVRRVNVAD